MVIKMYLHGFLKARVNCLQPHLITSILRALFILLWLSSQHSKLGLTSLVASWTSIPMELFKKYVQFCTKNANNSCAWWYIPVIPALRMWRHKSQKFKANLNYIKQPQQTKTKKEANNKLPHGFLSQGTLTIKGEGHIKN